MQKMLYEFLVSTKCWRKRCYMSVWRQQNVDAKDLYEFYVDAKRCYKRFGINKKLTLKDISSHKKVLFFTSTHHWRNDFKWHELLYHYASTFWLTLKVIFLVVKVMTISGDASWSKVSERWEDVMAQMSREGFELVREP